MKPDFLLVPLVLQQDPNIRPSDLLTYGVVYWYEHLRDGECRASNESIGDVIGIDIRTVSAGLSRLEKAGYIRIFYKDSEKRNRDRIECAVAFRFSQATRTSVPKALATDDGRGETPGEYARRFFKGDEALVNELVAEILTRTSGKGEDAIRAELRKFWTYWSEPNKSGTRQRWELEKTFDLKRRVYLWLSRAGTHARPHSSKAGAGAVV